MTDTPSAITFRELLDYSAAETEKWHRWLGEHPEVVDLPIGSGRTATIGGLIHHIIVVEIRYVDRLRGEPVTEYDAVPRAPLDDLFAAFSAGRVRLEEWLASATPEDLGQRLEFGTISAGTLTASKRKILAHTLVHGIRHWAQISTVARQSGFETGWWHDLLMSDAMT